MDKSGVFAQKNQGYIVLGHPGIKKFYILPRRNFDAYNFIDQGGENED
jgi:hypothetical protein